MPVRKFRDVSEMEGNTWLEPGSPELFRMIRAVWDFAERTAPVRFPRGVFKHRTIEEKQALRESVGGRFLRSFPGPPPPGCACFRRVLTSRRPPLRIAGRAAA